MRMMEIMQILCNAALAKVSFLPVCLGITTYKRPIAKIPQIPIFDDLGIFSFQIVGMGRSKIATSVIKLMAPIAVYAPGLSPHDPLTEMFQLKLKGRQIKKTCNIFAVHQARTIPIMILTARMKPLLTKMRR